MRPRRQWYEQLDEAVREAFPDVEIETGLSIFSLQYVSNWWVRGTEGEKLKPHRANQVRSFVRGFMEACAQYENEALK